MDHLAAWDKYGTMTYDDLPAHVVQVANQCILDWFGCALAGSTEPLSEILRNQFGHRSGACTIIGSDLQIEAPTAALLNGAAGHAHVYARPARRTRHVGRTAELAFEHFWERGITTMAFCGYDQVDFSERRRDAFIEYAESRDVKVRVFESGTPANDQRARASTLSSEARGEFDYSEMIEWLKSLPKPAAILAANDVRGRQILSACVIADIAVPEEIAVLGVDNDEVICELSHPPLSSIEPDTRSIGFAGAASLDMLMSEPVKDKASSARLIRPLGVVVRQSTDITAIDDLIVARAAKIVREQAESISSVEVLAEMVGLSRATLERRFRSALGRSPHQEIDRIRLDRARALVRGTTYPLHKIADMVGYSNASRLVDAYKRRFNITPGTDRQQSGDPFRDLTT